MTALAWQYDHQIIRDRSGVTRRVSIARPVPISPSPTVVYCADGQVVEILARRLSASGVQSAPILIGVHSQEATRAQEYLFQEHETYLAHEEFFVNELPVWAQTHYDIPLLRTSSVIFGFSNGGAFALTAALRHPECFAAAFSFSTPKLPALPHIDQVDTLVPSVYLAAGNVGPEKVIRKNVLYLARWLRKNCVPVTVSEKNAGHNMDFWATEFQFALDWFHKNAT